MPNDLHHVTLFVTDMDRSLYLYQDILGFELLWRRDRVGGRQFSAFIGVPDIELELVFLKARTGGVALDLARIIQPVTEKSSTLVEDLAKVGLCLAVEDADKLHKKLIEEGWIPFTPCVDFPSPDGDSVRGFCFRTDEGVNVEIIQVLQT